MAPVPGDLKRQGRHHDRRAGSGRRAHRHGAPDCSGRERSRRRRPCRPGQADRHRCRHRRVDHFGADPSRRAPLHLGTGDRQPCSRGVRTRGPTGRTREHRLGRGQRGPRKRPWGGARFPPGRGRPGRHGRRLVMTGPEEGSRGRDGDRGRDEEPGADPARGRVVLVTGGSRGIGLACAKWFLTRGDRVAVTSRTGAVEDRLDAGTDRFMSLKCDVTEPEQVTAAFSAIEEAWGPVEVLVANAGITRDTLVLRMSEEAWSEVIDTNLTAVFRVAKRALTKMIRLHRGRVIMISSVSAFIGSAGQANYAASKAGLVGMARSMAREVASRSITVNVVAPGLVETNMLAALGEERMREIRAQVPLGRVARAEEVAEAVGFLASAGAGYVTGVVLPVDGGLAMGL